LHARVFHERIEQPDCIRAAADARDRDVRQFSGRSNDLFARFALSDADRALLDESEDAS